MDFLLETILYIILLPIVMALCAWICISIFVIIAKIFEFLWIKPIGYIRKNSP